MSTPATLHWYAGHGERRFATASIGDRPAVFEITRGAQGDHRVSATIVVASTTGQTSPYGNNLLEELAQAWLDRVGGHAT